MNYLLKKNVIFYCTEQHFKKPFTVIITGESTNSPWDLYRKSFIVSLDIDDFTFIAHAQKRQSERFQRSEKCKCDVFRFILLHKVVKTNIVKTWKRFKACLHYATRLHATRRLRKVKGQRCCLQRGCLQYLLHVYTTQHGCCDEPLTGPQPTVWRHSCRHIFSRCDGRHV